MIFLFGCNPTKYVPEDKYLLNKVKIHVNNNKKINQNELKSLVRQKSNKKILGARVYLWFYNQSNLKKQRGIHKYLRSIGEEPAIWDPLATDFSAKQIKNYLNRKGYLNADVLVMDTINLRKRQVNIRYCIYPLQPYIIRSLKYAFEDTSIKQVILSDTVNSLLKKIKQPYFDEDLLGNERARIEYMMKDNGYFRFNRYMINIDADTSVGNHQVDLVMIFSNELSRLPDGSFTELPNRQYRINDVTIRTEPGRNKNVSQTARKDTILRYGTKFIYQNNFWVRPNIIQQSNYILPGSLFRISDVENTKTHLSSLNVFTSVNTSQFTELPSGDTSRYNYLNSQILLTPHDIQSYSLELEGTNSAGYIGGAFNVIYMHRSLFGNAENLQVKFRGAIEALKQINSNKISRMIENGVDATLNIPKFLIPFNSMGFRKKYNPKTYITWAYSYLDRPDFKLTKANMAFGYNWKGAKYKTHIVTPLDFNYVRVMDKDINFINLIRNTYLENLYNDHLISSSAYSYINNNQDLKRVSDYRYFRWNIESAGNLLQLYNSIVAKKPPYLDAADSIPPHKLFHLQYTQYLKTDFDFHYFHILNNGSGIVYRLFGGIGVPYGNATSLPFEKQYFSGGANSLRGWQVRTLGPGSYVDTSSVKNYPHSTGEIKLEANIEYRFKIFWLLEGALFTDVGNIWLIPGHNKPSNAEFRWNSFYKQIAVSSGFGLRFNFNYFIFRVDLGLKVRNPAIHKWLIEYSKVTHEDLGLSFAIGYPF